jgi:hypothetical protein
MAALQWHWRKCGKCSFSFLFNEEQEVLESKSANHLRSKELLLVLQNYSQGRTLHLWVEILPMKEFDFALQVD